MKQQYIKRWNMFADKIPLTTFIQHLIDEGYSIVTLSPSGAGFSEYIIIVEK